MEKTSSILTGGATFTAASLTPIVSWALAGFPQPVPESTAYLLTAALITLGHAAYNYLTAEKPKAP